MKYNFDIITNRRNTNSLKWEVKDNELPMWVADMDFPVFPPIYEALQRRIDIKAYGYSLIPEEYFEAVIVWEKRRHNLELKREWLIYSSGVVAAISSIVRRITKEGDKVIVLSPTYNIFYNSIINNKRIVNACNLEEKDGKFAINFEDLENKMMDERTTLLILCNPHNPLGHIWSKEDLSRIGELANKHGVIVISDEIHSDIVDPGYQYVPFISANEINKEISITCFAASKTFNIAGLQSAVLWIPNESLRNNVNRGLNNDEVAEPNFFSMDANIVAFNEGDEYVDQLNEYIAKNKEYLYEFVKRELPHLKAYIGHATYLVWINVSYYDQNSIHLAEELRNKTGLYISEGREYGENGNGYIRINLATSLENVKDGLNRLKKYIDMLEGE